jgi:phosphomevalonate kinase
MKIVFLLGLAKSGKDTIGNQLVNNYEFTRVAFADAAKEEYAKQKNIDIKDLHIQSSIKEFHREGLILMAEEARKKDPEIWIKKALEPFLLHKENIFSFKNNIKNIVITDCRRKPEIDYILKGKALGLPFNLVLIEKPNNYDSDILTHETIGYAQGLHKALTIYEKKGLIDAIIVNDKDIESLNKKVQRLVEGVIFS